MFLYVLPGVLFEFKQIIGRGTRLYDDKDYFTIYEDELDQEKLTPLLRLKYFNSISDAIAALERPEEIGKVFAGVSKVSVRIGSVRRNPPRQVLKVIQNEPDQKA